MEDLIGLGVGMGTGLIAIILVILFTFSARKNVRKHVALLKEIIPESYKAEQIKIRQGIIHKCNEGNSNEKNEKDKDNEWKRIVEKVNDLKIRNKAFIEENKNLGHLSISIAFFTIMLSVMTDSADDKLFSNILIGILIVGFIAITVVGISNVGNFGRAVALQEVLIEIDEEAKNMQELNGMKLQIEHLKLLVDTYIPKLK